MSVNQFGSFCDDFYVNLRLGSNLELPLNRETVLHFFERLQKPYPEMTRFKKSQSGECTLEECRSSNLYRWVSLESKRISSGFVNPDSIEDGIKYNTFLLQMVPDYLNLSHLEIDYLDVLFGFDLTCNANHDEVIADSLYADSPLTCLTEEGSARAVDFQPSVTVALSDDCRLQARIDVITRTNCYQTLSGDYDDEVISVYLILRRYWGDRPKTALHEMYREMAERAEQLALTYIVPRILRPISSAIASRS